MGIDEEDLDEALDRWREEGVIDAATAEEIRTIEVQRHSKRTLSGEDGIGQRLVEIISIMGAALVGTGVVLLLWTYWDTLSVTARSIIVIAAPLASGTVGMWLRRSRTPRVGFAIWFLGIGLLGPMFILLMDMHLPEAGMQVPLLLWAVCAIPAGYFVPSRLISALGLFVLLGAAWVATPSADGPFALALLGSIIVTVGVIVRSFEAELAQPYQLIGLLPVVGALLFIGIRRGEVDAVQPGFEPLLTALVISSVAVGAVVAFEWVRGSVSNVDVLLIGSVVTASVVGIVVVIATPPLPALGSFFLIHAVLLLFLLGLIGVGLGGRMPAMINFVVGAFFVQVLTFSVTTIGDALPGSVALVITGVVLLIVGVLLERGRRRILGTMYR